MPHQPRLIGSAHPPANGVLTAMGLSVRLSADQYGYHDTEYQQGDGAGNRKFTAKHDRPPCWSEERSVGRDPESTSEGLSWR